MEKQKIKEAIEEFGSQLEQHKIMLSYCKAEYETAPIERTIQHIVTAVETLKKQLPEKVVRRTEFKDLYENLLYFQGFCPICGAEVQSYRNGSCHICGQMLDWLE